MILGIMILFILLGFAFLGQWYRLTMMDKEIAQWKTNLTEAKEEQALLTAEKEQLSEASYIAILAREKLFYIFPGEKIWLQSTQNDHILTSVETEGIIAE